MSATRTVIKRSGATGPADFPIGAAMDIPKDAPLPEGYEEVGLTHNGSPRRIKFRTNPVRDASGRVVFE